MPERSNASVREVGLLILRVGLGMMFMFHGAPKLFGGPDAWARVGTAMATVGIHFMPVFWGLMAACSEFVGGLCLILGLFTRFASCLMTITMVVAAVMHLRNGDGLQVASHAIEAAIVFFSLIWIGPGKLSADQLLDSRSSDSRYSLPL